MNGRMRERRKGLSDYRISSFQLWGIALLPLCLALGIVSSAVADEISASEIADQQGLTVAEKKALKGAIEDYEFQEQAKAIATLEVLRQKHPTNLNVLRYVGLSYEESKRYAEALGAYTQWLKYGGNSMNEDARFAWMGIAKSYDKTKHTAMGIKLIRQWLDKHPDDYDATVVLGDMMVREKDYEGTKAMFKTLLSKSEVPANYQASAHYYLGFIAWLEGDVNEVQAQGKRVLRVEPEGGFASVIKQLMETPPPRKLGLNVTTGIDGFFVDNVEFKPTYRIATKGNSRTTGINTALGLTWNFRHHLAANYNFGGTFYSKRSDLNLGLHMFGITWADNGVQFGPRYEYVTMYNKLLYQAMGADLGWGIGKWMLIESARLKVFSRAVKVLDANGNVLTPNLSYLSGWNNSLMLMRQATWNKTIWMIGANVVLERTRGNATNNKKLNDFEGPLPSCIPEDHGCLLPMSMAMLKNIEGSMLRYLMRSARMNTSIWEGEQHGPLRGKRITHYHSKSNGITTLPTTISLITRPKQPVLQHIRSGSIRWVIPILGREFFALGVIAVTEYFIQRMRFGKIYPKRSI